MPVQLTLNILTGETTLQPDGSTNVVAVIAPPSDYQPGALSEGGWVWRWWQQATNCPDCWGIEGAFPPPTISLSVSLADINDYAIYASNMEAEAEAAVAALAASTPTFTVGGGFTAMDDDDMMGGGDPCAITNESAPFSVVSVAPDGSGDMILSWQSCTDHIYVVESESSLTPTSSWTDVAWMFGTDRQTSWTDTNAVGLTQNFYRVVRGNPNTLNGGIPYGWAVTYGLDPLDPNLASETSTNPWAHGLTNLQVYQNPSVLIADNYETLGDGIPDWWRVTYFGVCTTTNTDSCATCDLEGDGWNNLDKYLYGMNPLVYYSPFDFIVNGGQPYTASLNVPVQPVITNLPDFLVSLNPRMSNATLFANSGGAVNYTLPNNGDGGYELFVQYADAQGQPVGPVLSEVVVLDQTPPVVHITSPASGAVLNQAFITLQAVAADPNPVVPDGVRQLSIWINGQRLWDRDLTNIVVKRFPVPTGSNSLTVTIKAVDQAGNTNTASRTWPINLSTATNAPNLLTVNLSSSMLLPNVGSIWVEGDVDNAYALITAIVSAASGDVTTNSLHVRQSHFEGAVPLASGTNQVELTASDAAGNTSSSAYAITNPGYGAFATVPSNTVSGYVSALFDAGLPTQTNITTITINGVAAVLGTNVDAYGNVPFWTTNVIPLGVPITATIGGPGIPTDPPGLQSAQSQVYEVTHKETWTETVPCCIGPSVVTDATAATPDGCQSLKRDMFTRNVGCHRTRRIVAGYDR